MKRTPANAPAVQALAIYLGLLRVTIPGVNLAYEKPKAGRECKRA